MSPHWNVFWEQLHLWLVVALLQSHEASLLWVRADDAQAHLGTTTACCCLHASMRVLLLLQCRVLKTVQAPVECDLCVDVMAIQLLDPCCSQDHPLTVSALPAHWAPSKPGSTQLSHSLQQQASQHLRCMSEGSVESMSLRSCPTASPFRDHSWQTITQLCLY